MQPSDEPTFDLDLASSQQFAQLSLQFGDQLNAEMNSAVKAWESSKVNIAVIGETYVGKSTHINSHFGNYAASAGHAGDTTQRATPYGQTGPINETNPDSDTNEVLVFWDLPGFNTIHFNRETYDAVVKLDRYHFFLILTDKIFTHDIHWLLGEILRRNKRFFLVRTKIDQAVENASNYPPRQTRDEVIRETRQKIERGLTESLQAFKTQNPNVKYAYNPDNFKVYFVHNHKPSDYDFPQLREDLWASMSSLQREVYLMQCRSYSKQMRNEKFKNFKKRIFKIGAASAAGAPIPGSTLLFDIPLISYEVFQYMKAFGVDKQTIREMEVEGGFNQGRIERPFKEYLQTSHKALCTIRETIGETRSVTMPGLRHLAPVIVGALGLIAASGTAETAAEAAVPIVGVAVASLLSFGTTSTQLYWLLNSAYKANEWIEKNTAHFTG